MDTPLRQVLKITITCWLTKTKTKNPSHLTNKSCLHSCSFELLHSVMSIPKAHPAKCGTRPGEKASTYFIPSRSSKQQQQQQNRHEMVKPSRIRVRSVAPDSNEEDPRDTFLIYSENVALTSRDRLCAVRSNGADKQKKKKKRRSTPPCRVF